jgi:hypothetical protein
MLKAKSENIKNVFFPVVHFNYEKNQEITATFAYNLKTNYKMFQNDKHF